MTQLCLFQPYERRGQCHIFGGANHDRGGVGRRRCVNFGNGGLQVTSPAGKTVAGRRHRMAVNITYARPVSHDQIYYANPIKMLEGRVEPPGEEP